jgi:hypothetical protein
LGCPDQRTKTFRFLKIRNHGTLPPFRCPQEGRFAIVTNVGRGMRWTR